VRDANGVEGAAGDILWYKGIKGIVFHGEIKRIVLWLSGSSLGFEGILQATYKKRHPVPCINDVIRVFLSCRAKFRNLVSKRGIGVHVDRVRSDP
jgi:hypothetical protein